MRDDLPFVKFGENGKDQTVEQQGRPPRERFRRDRLLESDGRHGQGWQGAGTRPIRPPP